MQRDFFLCDVLDAVPKDDIASMEHPVFSLATRPDRRTLSYHHNDTSVEITPSVKGLATIHDKDVLIFATSQLIAALNQGRPVAPTIQFTAHDMLLATGRETSGDGYRRLRAALERLSGTRIVTTIPTGGVEVTTGFGLIEGWEIVRRTKGGRMVSVAVTLSPWLYRAVLAKAVLTLSRDYFALRRPLERRLYELARKHCGHQPRWRIGLETLLKKSGSASPRRVFRAMLREIVAEDRLPDYSLAFAEDLLTVRPRAPRPGQRPVVDPEVHAELRRAAPGCDPHSLEADWAAHWAATGRPRLHNPSAAFRAFALARLGARLDKPR